MIRDKRRSKALSSGGVAIAALGITAPKFRFEDSLVDAARTVKRLADQISADLSSTAK